jgi:hypothetical protein
MTMNTKKITNIIHGIRKDLDKLEKQVMGDKKPLKRKTKQRLKPVSQSSFSIKEDHTNSHDEFNRILARLPG